MALIIALGSNLGDRYASLAEARLLLEQHFKLTCDSKIIETEPVDYLEQPSFLNQVLEFEMPCMSAKECFSIIRSIENQMGRLRDIPNGPRNIDIDLIFFGNLKYEDADLIIPHPRALSRYFVMGPLKELPSYLSLKSFFKF